MVGILPGTWRYTCDGGVLWTSLSNSSSDVITSVCRDNTSQVYPVWVAVSDRCLLLSRYCRKQYRRDTVPEDNNRCTNKYVRRKPARQIPQVRQAPGCDCDRLCAWSPTPEICESWSNSQVFLDRMWFHGARSCVGVIVTGLYLGFGDLIFVSQVSAPVAMSVNHLSSQGSLDLGRWFQLSRNFLCTGEDSPLAFSSRPRLLAGGIDWELQKSSFLWR